jgi:hypothetical protein
MIYSSSLLDSLVTFGLLCQQFSLYNFYCLRCFSYLLLSFLRHSLLFSFKNSYIDFHSSELIALGLKPFDLAWVSSIFALMGGRLIFSNVKVKFTKDNFVIYFVEMLLWQ